MKVLSLRSASAERSLSTGAGMDYGEGGVMGAKRRRGLA